MTESSDERRSAQGSSQIAGSRTHYPILDSAWVSPV